MHLATVQWRRPLLGVLHSAPTPQLQCLPVTGRQFVCAESACLCLQGRQASLRQQTRQLKSQVAAALRPCAACLTSACRAGSFRAEQGYSHLPQGSCSGKARYARPYDHYSIYSGILSTCTPKPAFKRPGCSKDSHSKTDCSQRRVEACTVL